ncbi:2TM domain-containing protein [Gelatiniphilus marinus]|uniref:2TM domain-containing protein n=1 Tax=Gelatiniphilus marinus TaxID=1759464 RepID=A0ABW5JSM4_9FLAO
MKRIADSETNKKALRARKRVEAIKGFYQHLFAYCLFTPFTIFINYKTYWDYKWFWFSVIGWGIAVAVHALSVFVKKGFFGSQWEARKIEELMRKEENR